MAPMAGFALSSRSAIAAQPATLPGAPARRAGAGAPARTAPRALGNFFGGGGGGGGGSKSMICIDCGYIYNGDFGALPRSYKCPECGVGKGRFKALTPQMKAVMSARKNNKARGDAGGGWYARASDNNMSAAQRAIAETQRRRGGKDPSAREKLLKKYGAREKAIDDKKRGGFW